MSTVEARVIDGSEADWIARKFLAEVMHEDRDHTRAGAQLGDSPICNCYVLAEKVLASLAYASVSVIPESRSGRAHHPRQQRVEMYGPWVKQAPQDSVPTSPGSGQAS